MEKLVPQKTCSLEGSPDCAFAGSGFVCFYLLSNRDKMLFPMYSARSTPEQRKMYRDYCEIRNSVPHFCMKYIRDKNHDSHFGNWRGNRQKANSNASTIDWREEDHPRDEDGKFTSGSGTASSADRTGSSSQAEAHPSSEPRRSSPRPTSNPSANPIRRNPNKETHSAAANLPGSSSLTAADAPPLPMYYFRPQISTTDSHALGASRGVRLSTTREMLEAKAKRLRRLPVNGKEELVNIEPHWKERYGPLPSQEHIDAVVKKDKEHQEAVRKATGPFFYTPRKVEPWEAYRVMPAKVIDQAIKDGFILPELAHFRKVGVPYPTYLTANNGIFCHSCDGGSKLLVYVESPWGGSPLTPVVTRAGRYGTGQQMELQQYTLRLKGAKSFVFRRPSSVNRWDIEIFTGNKAHQTDWYMLEFHIFTGD